MQNFFKKYKFYLILIIIGISTSSCDFFGLDNELTHFTIHDLELTSSSRYLYLTPPNERVEKTPNQYTNTRDSVFLKLQTELTEIKTLSFYRLQLDVNFPDSSLAIVDSIDVYLANTLDEKTRIGYLYDIPINTSSSSMDMILDFDEDEAGDIMKADTAFFITDISFRSTILSDSMVFKVSGLYNLYGENK